MNKSILISIIFAFALYSCNCEKGSGKLKSQEIKLQAFDEIVLKDIGLLFLSYSATPSMTIEIDDNLHEFINVEFKKNKMIISTNECISSLTEFNIDLSLPKFTSLDVSGSAEVICLDTFNLDEIKIKASGSGNVYLLANCKELTTKISGSGNVDLLGSVVEHDIEISGAGSLNAFEFITKEANIEVSGAGSCYISVRDKLDADVSGSGNIVYRGNPQKVNTEASGSGKIKTEY